MLRLLQSRAALGLFVVVPWKVFFSHLIRIIIIIYYFISWHDPTCLLGTFTHTSVTPSHTCEKKYMLLFTVWDVFIWRWTPLKIRSLKTTNMNTCAVITHFLCVNNVSNFIDFFPSIWLGFFKDQRIKIKYVIVLQNHISGKSVMYRKKSTWKPIKNCKNIGLGNERTKCSPFRSVWARDSFPRLVWKLLPSTGAFTGPAAGTQKHSSWFSKEQSKALPESEPASGPFLICVFVHYNTSSGTDCYSWKNIQNYANQLFLFFLGLRLYMLRLACTPDLSIWQHKTQR